MADEGSKKEWQRSKFCEANSEQKISGTATGHNGAPRSMKLNSGYSLKRSLTYMESYRSGHNGADSKGKGAYHSATCESSRFLAISPKCFIFLEFWMNAFQFRPCKSRAKFKHNQIRRDIEVVITGLTRNQFGSNPTRVRIPLSPPH